MEYEDYTTTQNPRKTEYEDYTTTQNPRKTEYEVYTTTQNPRITEYDDYTTTQNPRKTEYDDSTTTQFLSDTILEENPTGDIFKPSTAKKANNSDNLSLRWAKKQPTKCELVESFLDVKGSLIITSNNVSAMDRRLQTLEANFSELVTYINTKL